MRKRDEYQSKVTADTGLTRGRVPAPLLKHIGAKPGDRLIFRVDESGQAVMRLARVVRKPAKKTKGR
jgi:bifunctional DNA-binding transcriptional regulator/antitoxin component of YhaV-PrlF toxin-antitoxin module